MQGNPEAAWYADPMGRHQHRYWSGTQWTHHVADDGVAAVDELQTLPAAERAETEPQPAPGAERAETESQAAPAADDRRVEVPNTWGLGDGSPFSLPLHPDMARIFAETDKSEHYKIMFMYLVHPDPAVRLAALIEAEKIGWYPGRTRLWSTASPILPVGPRGRRPTHLAERSAGGFRARLPGRRDQPHRLDVDDDGRAGSGRARSPARRGAAREACRLRGVGGPDRRNGTYRPARSPRAVRRTLSPTS